MGCYAEGSSKLRDDREASMILITVWEISMQVNMHEAISQGYAST